MVKDVFGEERRGNKRASYRGEGNKEEKIIIKQRIKQQYEERQQVFCCTSWKLSQAFLQEMGNDVHDIKNKKTKTKPCSLLPYFNHPARGTEQCTYNKSMQNLKALGITQSGSYLSSFFNLDFKIFFSSHQICGLFWWSIWLHLWLIVGLPIGPTVCWKIKHETFTFRQLTAISNSSNMYSTWLDVWCFTCSLWYHVTVSISFLHRHDSNIFDSPLKPSEKNSNSNDHKLCQPSLSPSKHSGLSIKVW